MTTDQYSLHSAAAAPRGCSSDPRHHKLPFRGHSCGTSETRSDAFFKVANVSRQPNILDVIVNERCRDRTTDAEQRESVLAEYRAHWHAHVVCNRHARKHVISQCIMFRRVGDRPTGQERNVGSVDWF